MRTTINHPKKNPVEKVTAQSDLPHHDAEADIETERWRRLAELALEAENIFEGELACSLLMKK